MCIPKICVFYFSIRNSANVLRIFILADAKTVNDKAHVIKLNITQLIYSDIDEVRNVDKRKS